MSLLTKLISLTLFTLLSSIAHADQWGGFVGLNNSEYSGDGNWDRDFGIELGASYLKPLNGTITFRSGVGLVQRNSENGNTSVKFLYLEIPFTLMVQATNQLGIFSGLNLDLKVDNSPSSIDGEEFFAVSFPIGARYSVSGPHSLEGIVEFGVTDIVSGNNGTYQLGTTLVGRYVYTF